MGLEKQGSQGCRGGFQRVLKTSGSPQSITSSFGGATRRRDQHRDKRPNQKQHTGGRHVTMYVSDRECTAIQIGALLRLGEEDERARGREERSGRGA